MALSTSKPASGAKPSISGRFRPAASPSVVGGIGESAAGRGSPAALWRIELDAQAEPTSWQVKRALVKSVARLDYSTVQRDADAGTLHPSIALLPEFGRLRSVSAVAGVPSS